MATLQAFQRKIQTLDGQHLETLHRRSGFTVHVLQEGLEYTLDSSGDSRRHSWTSIQRVLERFNATASFNPKHYHDITFHSSYILAVLRQLQTVGGIPVEETSVLSPEARTAGLAHVDPLPRATSSRSQTPAQQEPHSDAPSKPHQRVGSISNAHVGSDFEKVALQYFANQGVYLSRDFPIEVGLATKKVHFFDLGSSDARLLVECKSHKWTAGGRVPSAKMTVWNEAMYYFFLAPADYRKVLFVLHDRREGQGESLLAYYKRSHGHLIPPSVELLEWDESSGDIVQL